MPPYTPTYPVWKDEPVHETLVSAAALNNMEAGIDGANQALDDHVADTVDAHDASAISVVPAGALSSSNVQSALQELQGDIIGGGLPSTIIDAKGDLIVGDAPDSPVRLPAGTNGQVLVADSTAPQGLKYATPASGLPDPAGHNGEVLTVVAGLPDWEPAAAGGSSIDYENAWAAGTAYLAGDVVNYNGVEYLAVNPSTGSTPPAVPGSTGAYPVVGYSTSLPGSPLDGQEHILVDSLTAPTYAWRLRYSAGKTSNKWVFVGGSPKVVEIPTVETTTSTSFADLATDGPSFSLPVAGSYTMHGEYNILSSVANVTEAAGLFANGIEVLSIPIWLTATGGPLSRPNGSIGVVGSAGHVLKMRYKVSTGTGSFSVRRLEVVPIAVGG